MGISLTGLTPATTYDALIKVGDNGPIGATLKTLSDGLGNDLPMQASTTAINFTGTVSGLASGVSGAIQFSNGSAFASDAANLFWDDTNNRLGIGTNAPTHSITNIGISKLQGIALGGVTHSNLNTNEICSFNSMFLFNRDSGGGLLRGVTINSTGTMISSDGSVASSAMLQIKGSGSTSATTSLLVQTSAGLPSLQVLDSRSVRINGGSGNGLTLEVGGTLEATSSSYLRGAVYGFNGFFAGMNSGENASAIIQADSTTRGFLPPRMTTTQKNAIASPAAGLVVYDTTMNATCEYTGTAWRVVSAGAQAVTVTGLLQTVSLANGNVLDITLNSSTTFTFTNPTIGTYILKLTQGVGGGFLVTWPVNVIWSGGTAPTLSTTAGKIDIITLIYDGTNYYGNYSLNY